MMARRTLSFAAADLSDDDAIKTAIATDTSPASYSGAALNGAAKDPETFSGFEDIAAIPSVTTSSSVGSFTAGSDIVFTGSYNGETVTRTATLVSANGNETVYADGPLDGAPTLITVEAQADMNGTLSFGWGGVAPKYHNARQRLWSLKCGDTSGNIHVRYGLGEDTIAAVAGEEYHAGVHAVLGDTAVALTVFET